MIGGVSCNVSYSNRRVKEREDIPRVSSGCQGSNLDVVRCNWDVPVRQDGGCSGSSRQCDEARAGGPKRRGDIILEGQYTTYVACIAVSYCCDGLSKRVPVEEVLVATTAMYEPEVGL
jgi:hypothetical protein